MDAVLRAAVAWLIQANIHTMMNDCGCERCLDLEEEAHTILRLFGADYRTIVGYEIKKED